MTNKWRTVILGDCIKINDAAYSPKEAWPFINYLDTGNITGNCISEIQYLVVGKDKIPSRARRKVQQGDIVYSTVRPNQRHFGLMKKLPNNFLASTGFAVISGKEDLALTDFIYWFLAQDHIVDHLQTLAEQNTSAYPSIRPSDIERLELKLPPLPEQRAIAHILGTLDDKIELNRRMNETLEEMARAIFKSWFVDFDPVRAKMDGSWRRGESLPGMPAEMYDLFPSRLVDSELGEIPEGWEVKSLGEVVITVRGRSYRSAELAESDTALVTLKSFARNGGYRPDGLKSYIGNYKPEQIIEPGEIIIACTDVTQAAEVIGHPAMVQPTTKYDLLVASLDVLIIRPKCEGIRREFLYFLCSTETFINHTAAYATGTTVLHLDKNAVPSFRLALPTQQLVCLYSKKVGPILEHILINALENENLVVLRDTLLPKLISGELRVPDAELIL